MADENVLGSLPRLARPQDVIVWAGLLIDRLRAATWLQLPRGALITTGTTYTLPPAADHTGWSFSIASKVKGTVTLLVSGTDVLQGSNQITVGQPYEMLV